MPFKPDTVVDCSNCQFGHCFEDLRNTPIRGRTTKFRLTQATALHCTFHDFTPGGLSDPDLTRSFDVYLKQLESNVIAAGKSLLGDEFDIGGSALAKVSGDSFELMHAALLWNAAVQWNKLMGTGEWEDGIFAMPERSVPSVRRKVGVLWLPRGYDTTLLFRPDVRDALRASQVALETRGMSLNMSAPDVVGIRLSTDLNVDLSIFEQEIPNFRHENRNRLENAYKLLEGRLDGRSFLFAVAVKRTIRSDRLYQPLFEANVLKYLIGDVLGGAAFKFYVILGSAEGADVRKHYSSAALPSLVRGGQPFLAIDKYFVSASPRHSTQEMLNDFVTFII